MSAGKFLLQDHVRQVEVAQVGGGDGAQQPDQRAGNSNHVAQGLRGILDQIGQMVDAPHPYSPLPGEMVQPDVLQADVARINMEKAGEPALEADRRVAEPYRPVPLVEQRLGHDPDRVREVDDPGPRLRPPAGLLRDLEYHRHRPQSLGEAAGSGGLLTDAAELEGKGLVYQPSGLPPDPQLDYHEIGAVEGSVAVLGHGQDGGRALFAQNPPSQSAHGVQADGVGIEQDQLVYGKARPLGIESADQLRRIGATPTEDRHLDAHSERILRECGLKWLGNFPEYWSSHCD